MVTRVQFPPRKISAKVWGRVGVVYLKISQCVTENHPSQEMSPKMWLRMHRRLLKRESKNFDAYIWTIQILFKRVPIDSSAEIWIASKLVLKSCFAKTDIRAKGSKLETFPRNEIRNLKPYFDRTKSELSSGVGRQTKTQVDMLMFSENSKVKNSYLYWQESAIISTYLRKSFTFSLHRILYQELSRYVAPCPT